MRKAGQNKEKKLREHMVLAGDPFSLTHRELWSLLHPTIGPTFRKKG